MAATITTTSSRVTVNGAYKEFSGTVSGNVITYSSGDALDSTDAGRFVCWMPSSTATAEWEVRYINSASATSLTMIDPLNGTTSGTLNFKISTTLDDLVAGSAGAVTNVSRLYSFNNRDIKLSGGAFLAAVDRAVEWRSASSTGWQLDDQAVMCFGILRSGENNGSTVTERGCHIRFSHGRIRQNVFSGTNSRSVDGPYIAFYGCSVDSQHELSGGDAWAFMRMRGPNRFIGSNFDGTTGGRFYHENSEFADCRMAGNNNAIPAWSIGATFLRDIENVTFLSGSYAAKNYLGFGGTFRNVKVNLDRFTQFFYVQGQSSSTINFIDCTTFTDSDVRDAGSGKLNQGKTINYLTAESDGTALQDVKVNVYNVDGLQMGAEVSASDGVVPEIVTIFYIWTNASPSANKAPFTIRLRKYGFVYQDFTSAVSEPIKQEYRLPDNTVTALSESAAGALTGIAVDYNNQYITVTESHTLSEIYDYCQADLISNMDEPEFFTSTDGRTFTLGSGWELRITSGADLTGTSGQSVVGTVRSMHSGTEVGPLTIIGDLLFTVVPVATYDGLTVTGMVKFGAGGTYNFTNGSLGELVNGSGLDVTVGVTNVTIGTNTGPNITVVAAPRTLTLNGLKADTEVRIYDGNTEVAGVELSGTSESFSIDANSVDIVIHALGYLNQVLEGIDTTSDVTLPISQVLDRQYNNPV
ncbi:structural protein [Synechococcus T7-like virus S-TIP28]|uniref:Structural protein n=1 Tax=Synechococcus T7-like virus S-TIP28 TaxID=1332140 RepID=A0AAE8XFQ0_9CAUD|nr:structural protein [Synechococcus T7-like virus S-TIP28]